MRLQQPRNAAGIPACFLVGREGGNDVASGHEMTAPHFDQARGHGRDLSLHVDGTAAIQPPVLLGQPERIDAPLLARRFNDVEVTEVQHRPCCPTAVQPDDEVALGRVIGRGEHHDVLRGKSGGAKARRERLCGTRRAVVMRRIDFHQFPEQVAGERVHRGRCRRRSGPGPGVARHAEHRQQAYPAKLPACAHARPSPGWRTPRSMALRCTTIDPHEAPARPLARPVPSGAGRRSRS